MSCAKWRARIEFRIGGMESLNTPTLLLREPTQTTVRCLAGVGSFRICLGGISTPYQRYKVYVELKSRHGLFDISL